jgi:AcrR family transcriptional regulator
VRDGEEHVVPDRGGQPVDQPTRGGPPEGRDAASRGDTRSRIQAVAVELFSEQGYDKTSLREIAERLGVTKAALYYHFKSKEDIVRSLIDDYFGRVDALVAWASQQPKTPAVRAEILSRYLDMVIDSHQVYRMLQQNQAALAGLTSEKHRGQLFRERMNALIDLLVEPGAALRERVRAAVATTGLSIGWMLFHDQVDDPAELRSAVLGIAFELAGGPAEAADQPEESGPGPAWPPAAARTSGSTR